MIKICLYMPVVWLCVASCSYGGQINSGSTQPTPKGFSCSHILYSPGRSWNKMDVTWSRVPEPSNPRGLLTSAPLLSTLPGPDVCVFTLSLSPDFLGLLSHDCTPAPSDRGCQLAVRHSGGSSWINSLCTKNGSLTHTRSASWTLLYIYIKEESYKKMATKIDM